MSTTKISVSIDQANLAWLRRRAKRIHAGNLSAAVAEATVALRKQEALREFLAGEGVPDLDAGALAEIRREWQQPRRRAKKNRAA